MREFFESVRLIVGLTLILLLIYGFYWMRPAKMGVDDQSMMPNIKKNQRVYFSRSVHKITDVSPGDIILYYSLDPKEKQRMDYISRIVAVPGQRVAISSGKLIIDGKPPTGTVDQSGIIPNNVAEFMVPREYVFVLYDKRDDDSRKMWQRLVHLSHIEGKRLSRD